MPDAVPAPAGGASAAPPVAAPPQGGPHAPDAVTPAPAPGAAPEAATAQLGEAKQGEQATETKEQKQARLSAASRAARRNAARNRELVAQNSQFGSQAQQATQRAQTVEQGLARLRQLAQSNPYAFAKEMGLDTSKLAAGAVKDGSPEAQAEARIRAAEELAKQANDKFAKLEQDEQRRQFETGRQSAIADFTKQASDATAFPSLSKMPHVALLAWADRVVAADRAAAQRALSPEEFKRYAPTNRQLLVHMEKLAAQTVEPPKAATPESTPDAKPNGSAPPTTVSAALASAKYTMPANFDSLSDSEQKWHLARQMEGIVPGAKVKRRSA